MYRNIQNAKKEPLGSFLHTHFDVENYHFQTIAAQLAIA